MLASPPRPPQGPRIAIFGVATPYAWDVVETALRAGLRPVCVDNLGAADQDLPGLTGSMKVWPEVALGPASPRGRSGAAHAAWSAGAREYPSLVDPTAAVARSSDLGHAAYVNAQVAVGAKAHIGCFVNLNRSVSIGHHCTLGPFTATGPSATTCGHVTTGAGAFLGAGCVVLPGVSVGERSVVGAGAVVTRDVAAGVVVLGNPARVVGEASWREGELSCPTC